MNWARALLAALLIGVVGACSPSSAFAPGAVMSPAFMRSVQASPSPVQTPSAVPQLPAVVHPIRGALVGAACALPALMAPTSAPTPQLFSDYDPTTGLHITGSAPRVELASYRLTVTGEVVHPLSLTYDELRCLPKVGVTCELVCPGVFVDSASWAGAPLDSVLSQAGVEKGAQSLVLVGADGYSTLIDLSVARSSHGFLAYELNGGILPVLHGFPVRAVFPGVEGSFWAKWLVRIEVH